jgi:hypothetical protein
MEKAGVGNRKFSDNVVLPPQVPLDRRTNDFMNPGQHDHRDRDTTVVGSVGVEPHPRQCCRALLTD